MRIAHKGNILIVPVVAVTTVLMLLAKRRQRIDRRVGTGEELGNTSIDAIK